MVALVRPGGVVALHEAYWGGHACDPLLPAWAYSRYRQPAPRRTRLTLPWGNGFRACFARLGSSISRSGR